MSKRTCSICGEKAYFGDVCFLKNGTEIVGPKDLCEEHHDYHVFAYGFPTKETELEELPSDFYTCLEPMEELSSDLTSEIINT